MNREALGWDEWFARQAKDICEQGNQIARVTAVDRDQLSLLNEDGLFRGRLSGRFRFGSHSSEQMPCVGDWVCVEKGETGEFSLIRHLLERKTHLQRKAPGGSSEYQMIAANIDVVFIVQSCHFDFNVKRLERYLVMVAEGRATPHILLTKTDLITPEALVAQTGEIELTGISAPIVTLSNVTGEGIDELSGLLQPGKTYCFVGSSGVGKSTLINALVGKEIHETKHVSDTGEGRHTTVRRELIVLDSGAMLIDNPGMREFGILGDAGDIDAGFVDIAALAESCRYRDCTHTSEPGCVVLKAIEEGEISQSHYENFIKLKKELEFNQLSYSEKRKKDRDFGKFIKNAKKDFEH